MAKRWRIQPHDAERILSLERSARISPVLAQLLVSRGVRDAEAARRFLEARLSQLREPEDMPGIREAADRLHAAIAEKRKIAVYGDYDADGMTGTAILWLCVRLLGGDASYFVPNRLEEGYGLHSEAIRSLAGRGAALIVSVDCGISSVVAAETAAELGLELIITDHHELPPELPRAAAIVHPGLPSPSAGFPDLCGAGVAFKLAWALCCRASQSKKVSPRMRDFLLSAIGLAALGTVADVVPLVDENRILVRHGLVSLRERPRPGIQSLMAVMELDRKPTLSSEDVAFGLAPRLNAAGRLGQAQLGVELLTTDSADRARALADYIHQLNSSRESLERSVYLAASKQIKEQCDPEGDPAFVLAGTGWHPGVLGIVAGRLAEKYHRPVVLVAMDQAGARPATGSGRSACGLNLHQALSHCREHLLSHGGHAAAAGLKMEEASLPAFRAAFCEYVARCISPEDRMAEITIDAEAPLSQLTLNTVQQVEQLAPFGVGNPRPILCASSVAIAEPPRKLGAGDRHLAVKLTQHHVTLRAVAFGRGEWLDELTRVDRPIDVAYRPVINDYRGRRSVELHLVDWRVSPRPALAVHSPGG